MAASIDYSVRLNRTLIAHWSVARCTELAELFGSRKSDRKLDINSTGQVFEVPVIRAIRPCYSFSVDLWRFVFSVSGKGAPICSATRLDGPRIVIELKYSRAEASALYLEGSPAIVLCL